MNLPHDARDLVTATLSAAHRGGSLLNRIADITGAREWNPVPADLRALLGDLETLAAPALPVGMELQYPEPACRMRCCCWIRACCRIRC